MRYLHFSQLYILSPLSSSAEKKYARQSFRLTLGWTGMPLPQVNGVLEGEGKINFALSPDPDHRPRQRIDPEGKTALWVPYRNP